MITRPILSNIFFTNQEPTLNRQTKDFAAFEKQRIDQHKEFQKRKYEARCDSIREKTFESVRTNIPCKIENNAIEIKSPESNQRNFSVPIDRRTYTRLDPILGKVFIDTHEGSKYRVDYMPDSKFNKKKEVPDMKAKLHDPGHERPMF